MRVLIFAKKSSLKDVGGPTGYIYNISEYLKQNPSNEIFFLPEKPLGRTFWGFISTSLYLFFTRLFKSSKHIRNILEFYSMFFRYERYDKKTIEYLNSFDYIHLHHTPYYFTTFKKNKIKAKKIITLHSPEPYTYETLEMAGLGKFADSHPNFKNYFLKKEIKIFYDCDYVMFPVPEAKEPYIISSLLYKETLKDVEYKTFYVPTSLYSVDMIEGRTGKLDELNLPIDALKVCYIGRHNQIKGYDFLQDTAKLVWNKGIDAYFIIGGKEGPIYGLNDKRWVELGWVKTPHLLNEVDVFVLPNKQTYFDLILLEVLRQGGPVILSRTGGNKWFEQFNLEGMFFFEYGNTEELTDIIMRIKKIKEENRLSVLRESNKNFIKDNLNMGIYFERYLKALRAINNENE